MLRSWKTAVAGSAGCAAALLTSVTALAQPVNDSCAGAIALTAGTPYSGDNSTATSTGDGVASTCQGNVKNGVWFTITTGAAQGGVWRISTCATAAHDTVLTIYQAGATCADIGTASNILLCDDDNGPDCTGTRASMDVTLAPGSTYLLRLQTWNSGTSGPFTLLAGPRVATGVCCDNATGVCTQVFGGACATGTTQGTGLTCTPTPCAPVAACCNDVSGLCTTIFGGACPTGTTQTGTGTTCLPSPCAPSQACCSGTTCTVVLVATGCGGGTAQGQGTTCTPNRCFPADECATTTQVATLGTQTGTNVDSTTSFSIQPGTLCPGIVTSSGGFNDVFWRFTAPATTTYTLDTCGAVGFDTVLSVHDACPATSSNVLACNDDSSAPAGNTACSESTLRSRIQSVALTGGHEYTVRIGSYLATTFGAYTLNIAYTNAAGVGACCVGSGCTLTDATTCTGGAFIAGVPCTPSPCGMTLGVCCRGATCNASVASAVVCSGTLVPGQTAGAVFLPAVTACNSGPVSNAPCCYADYNKVGGISVQDIFDFLSDWFAGSAYANTGGSGASGPLSVQNIFDFLNDWFAGGC